MPRFMSPMIRRRPSADKVYTESHTVDTNEPRAVQSAFQESAQPSTEQSAEQPAFEQQTPPDIRVSEGGFKQIRDESLSSCRKGLRTASNVPKTVPSRYSSNHDLTLVGALLKSIII